jgi:hypothetical protein
MSRHLGPGTFEFSHEDLGPSTWPVLAPTLGGGKPISTQTDDAEFQPEAAQPEAPPKPFSIEDLISILEGRNALAYGAAVQDAIDMLYRLALPDGGRGAHETMCEAACREALGAFVCGVDRADYDDKELAESDLPRLCVQWLKESVVPALCNLTTPDNQVTRRAKLVHELAARVGALSHTPMRTLLSTPGESSSAFSRSALPLLHDSINEELNFAALVIASTKDTTIDHSSTTDVDAKLAAAMADNKRLQTELAARKGSGEKLADLGSETLNQLVDENNGLREDIEDLQKVCANENTLLQYRIQEYEAAFAGVLEEMDIKREEWEKVTAKEREAVIEYRRMKTVAEGWSRVFHDLIEAIKSRDGSVKEVRERLRAVLQNVGKAGTTNTQGLSGSQARSIFKELFDKMDKGDARVNEFIQTEMLDKAHIGGPLSPERRRSTSPRSSNTTRGVELGVELMGGNPWGTPSAGPGTPHSAGLAARTATRKLTVRIDAMIRGWCGSVAASDECAVSSLARHCFAEVTSMSADVAKQGPAGWLGIIDPRCPVATQFDTLIVHYLNATRRASGNRPGYDKDFRRHAGAYRQQLYFFKSVKLGPPNGGCVCNEKSGIICIYPGNASIYTGSPPCTAMTAVLQKA